MQDKLKDCHKTGGKLSVVWHSFVVFESLLCSKVHLFDQKYSKNSNIVKYYYAVK